MRWSRWRQPARHGHARPTDRGRARRDDPNVVKAVVAFDPPDRARPGALLHPRHSPPGAGPVWHHIGIYAFRRAALERFAALPPSPLEQREKLEQLRALEHGMSIGVRLVETVPFGVDTPADLERARALEPGVSAADSRGRHRPTGAHRLPGQPGAYSHMACRQPSPSWSRCPAIVRGRVRGRARRAGALAMIPVDNSLAGRVADVHHLLPAAGCISSASISSRVNLQLLAVPAPR